MICMLLSLIMNKSSIVARTEDFLTWRKKRKLTLKQKHARKHPVRDWLEAFLQAALIVLVINQYLVQAYQIPSASMRNTLLEGDRIFVNKMIFGPQLLPGMGKMPGIAEPRRGEVIILENPDQHSRGPAFTILHRIIYMFTLSMVDIDRDESGQPRASLLIKRAIGMGGDRIRSLNGNLYIRPAGASQWIADTELIWNDNDHPVRRLVPDEAYELMPELAAVISRSEAGLAISAEERQFVSDYSRLYPPDVYTRDQLRMEYRSAINPADFRYTTMRKRNELGWYLPAETILTVGDNRDNSLDGRSYGFVGKKDILGKALFIYWPPQRWGGIE